MFKVNYNTDALQKDILAWLLKTEGGHNGRIGNLKNGRLALTMDGCAVYTLYKPCIDFSNTLVGPWEPERLFEASHEYSRAYCTKDLKQVDKRVLIRIANDNEEVWINEKFIKYFDRNDVEFYIKPKNPVLIKSGDYDLALILPVNNVQ